MRIDFDCGPAVLQAIEKTMSPFRLGRYLGEVGNDKLSALRLYVWNSRLCEAFYLPMQFAEITVRNAIHSGLAYRYKDKWYTNKYFTPVLNETFRQELARVISEEWGQHGRYMTQNHVVSSLSFGFWEHLTTKRFKHLLWKNGLRHQFPQAPRATVIDNVRAKIERIRRWRNRIAHYGAIFDKSPQSVHQEILELIGWVCSDTAIFVETHSTVLNVIGFKPKTPFATENSASH